MILNYFKDTPQEKFEDYNDFALYIKREDKTFAGFGVKLRKIYGLVQFLKKGNVQDVLLYGNPHSNFLSTFSTVLKLEGFTIHSLFYTNDQNLITANSILSKRFSDTIIHTGSKGNREFYISAFQKGFPNGFVIPEFGIHKSGLVGLTFLWRELEKSEFLEYLFLDIGTGFTTLSALEYFKEKKVQIIGVAIGNRRDKIQTDLETNADKLGLDKKILANLKILEPFTSPAFASKNKTLEDWIRKTWKEKQIPLEPVYSAKTLLTVQEYIKSQKLKGAGVYMHQGGLLNHLKYFSNLSIIAR